MFRSFLIRSGLIVLTLLAGQPRPSHAATSPNRNPRPGLSALSRLTPRALEAWRWRASMDSRGRASWPGALGTRRISEDPLESILNDTTGTRGTAQSEVRVASQVGQNILVAWREGRGGDGDIFAALLDPNGIPVQLPGHPMDHGGFVVNDDPSGSAQSHPVVAVNRRGDFALAWQDGRNGGSDIYLQIFHADGSSDTGNVKANLGRDDETRFQHSQPALAMDDSGNVAVSWVDNRSSDVILSTILTDVYAQRFHANGTANGGTFLVSDTLRAGDYTLRTVANIHPTVAFTGGGDTSLVIAWTGVNQQDRGGLRGIYARRMSVFQARLGIPVDTVITRVDDGDVAGPLLTLLSSDPVLLEPAPAQASDTTRAFIIAWVDSSGGLGAVRARRLQMGPWLRGKAPFSESSHLISDADGIPVLQPDLIRLSDGSLALGWIQADGAGGVSTPHMRRIQADLAGGDPGVALETTETPLVRSGVSLAAFGNPPVAGAVFAAWSQVSANNNLDVVVRVVGAGSSSDSVLGEESQPDQINPDLAANVSGQAAVAVWTDFRAGLGDPDIYAQRLDAAGHAVGPNIKVNSDAPGAFQDHPRVAVDGTGAFTVAWEDARNGTFQVYARRFGPGGAPAGPEYAISANDSLQQFRPSLAGNSAGSVLAVWEDNRRGFPSSLKHAFDIDSRRLDPTGAVGNTVRISPFVGDSSVTDGPRAINAAPKLDPAAAMDESGNGFVFWTITAPDSTNNRDVDARYVQNFTDLPGMVDGAGRVIASQAFSVADTLGSGFLFPQQRARAAWLGGGAYVVTFEDERFGTTSREDVRARVFEARSLRPDTAQVYFTNESFLCNDDTVRTAPDFAGNSFFLSASQFQPSVAARPADSTFTVLWSDFRTQGNYNIVRQSYHYVAASDPSQPARLRYLGRNTFVNSDTLFQEGVHGMASACYSGSGQLTALWQVVRAPKRDWDIASRSLTLAPDTCTLDDCKLASSAAITLRATIQGGGGVALTWNVPAALSGGRLRLVRYHVNSLSAAGGRSTEPAPGALVLGDFAADAGVRSLGDTLSGNPGAYAYILLRGSQVVASAVPTARVAPLSFSLQLGQATPNPARGRTRIQFTVPGSAQGRSQVSLHLYDVSGRLVRTLVSDTRAPGDYSVEWRGETQGAGLASAGVYFLRMESAGQSAVRKVMWLR